MQPKSSAIMVTLLAAGAILVIAGATLFSVNNSASGKFTFTSHSKARLAGSPGSPVQRPAVAGASSGPSASGRPTAIPSLSPADTIYPVVGTMLLSPGNTPVANHEIDIVGSIPSKTYTDAQGRFTVHLPVGHYLLTLNPAVGPGGQSWPFTVARQPLTLNLTAKSGR